MSPRIKQNGADSLADGGSTGFARHYDVQAQAAQRFGQTVELRALTAAIETFDGDELSTGSIFHGSMIPALPCTSSGSALRFYARLRTNRGEVFACIRVTTSTTTVRGASAVPTMRSYPSWGTAWERSAAEPATTNTITGITRLRKGKSTRSPNGRLPRYRVLMAIASASPEAGVSAADVRNSHPWRNSVELKAAGSVSPFVVQGGILSALVFITKATVGTRPQSVSSMQRMCNSLRCANARKLRIGCSELVLLGLQQHS